MGSNMQIPKIINYTWFGGNPKSQEILDCIESWKKYMPDYEIIEWNEDNFDINYNKYTADAYAAKKWAHVSNVARLYALYYNGGIYMDTDNEVFKSFDCFLDNEGFTGFESVGYPVTAVMGCVKGNPLFKELLDYYDTAELILIPWQEFETNTKTMSNTFAEKGIDRYSDTLQKIEHLTVYPREYFCPDYRNGEITENTYAIHLMMGSWGDN